MPFDGNGNFLRIYDWTDDRDNGVKIRADRFDAEMDGMATGLSTCITKDGQTIITDDIPMNSKKFTGLADGTATGQSVHVGQVRKRLSADGVYYVRTDGSNSNDGLANTAGGAWLTLQYAWDWCLANIDLNGHYLNIHVADGTYTSATYVLQATGLMVGQTDSNHIQIIGNTTTPANVVINGDLAAMRFTDNARVAISGFKITSAATGLDITQGAWVNYGYIAFHTCGGPHYWVTKAAQAFDNGNNTITGNATAHAEVGDTGIAYETSGSTTISSVTFSTAYVQCITGQFYNHSPKSYVNPSNASGPRFNAILGGRIEAETMTNLPGTSAGTLDELSTFLALDSTNTMRLYPEWETSFTPVVTVGTGGSVTATATSRIKRNYQNRLFVMTAVITVTANTATGWLAVSLPSAGPPTGTGAGFATWDLTGTGTGVLGVQFDAGTNAINLTKYDGTVPTGTGIIKLTAIWEAGAPFP